MVQKDSAPVRVRKHPEVLCLSLGMRISRVGKKPQDIVRVLAQTQQEISHRGLLDTATLLAVRAWVQQHHSLNEPKE